MENIEQDKVGQELLQKLDKFSVSEVLNIDLDIKSVFLLGKFENDGDNQAILILFKKPFPVKDLKLPGIKTSEQYFHNDIFRRYTTVFGDEFNKIDTQIIYPATQKFINKYRQAEMILFEETPEIYEKKIKPFIEKDAKTSLQWVYNILDGQKEKEAVLYKDEDPQNGFLLMRDYKYPDITKVDSMHLLAIVNRKDLFSLRDLTDKELPLLEEIYNQGVHIKDKMFTINCGDGTQKIRWLGDVAVFRYDHFYGKLNGCPKGVRFETGALLPMDGIINQSLQDEEHVWVILKEDMEGLGIEKEKKKQSGFRIRPGTAFQSFKK